MEAHDEFLLIQRKFIWINKARNFALTDGILSIETEPGTDLWQRTFYGFSIFNAPSCITELKEDFTFRVKANFVTKNQYDQCGVLLFLDPENWIKISIEHENNQIARLGSVSTTFGFSDWASTDIAQPIQEIWYSVGRRGKDILIEYATAKDCYKQMRILYIHKPFEKIGVGVYACSPKDSSFVAKFSSFQIGSCLMPEHKPC